MDVLCNLSGIFRDSFQVRAQAQAQAQAMRAGAAGMRACNSKLVRGSPQSTALHAAACLGGLQVLPLVCLPRTMLACGARHRQLNKPDPTAGCTLIIVALLATPCACAHVQNVADLLDDLFQRAAAADEPEDMNYVRKHARAMGKQVRSSRCHPM